jgi:hypothetical protein
MRQLVLGVLLVTLAAVPASAATISLIGVYNDNDFPAPETVNAILHPHATMYLAKWECVEDGQHGCSDWATWAGEIAATRFDVTTASDTRSGTWSFLGYQELVGSVLRTWQVDYFVLKAGPKFALYSVTPGISGAPPSIPWNTGDIHHPTTGSHPEMSHLTWYGSYTETPVNVPEPAMLFLFGGGLLAAAATRRQTSRSRRPTYARRACGPPRVAPL